MALVRVYCGVAAAEMAPWLTVAVVDDSGRLLDMRHISDDPAGYAYLGALLADRSGGAAPVAMDRHDHLIAQLLAAAARPLAIADEASLADFADRFSDDTSYEEAQAPQSQRAAVGLARALQAGALYATAQSPSWNLDEFKPLLAAHGAVTAGRQAAAAALREVLRELYPAALRAYPDPAEYVPLRILEALPEPSMLTASPTTRNRESALIAELSASGVADTTTTVSAITALRVAVQESPRWNANRGFAPVVAETVMQAVAAVRACDCASAALIGSLVERLSTLTGGGSSVPPRPYLVHSSAAPVSPALARRGPAAEVPPSRLSPRASAASAAASGMPTPAMAIPSQRGASDYADPAAYGHAQSYPQPGYPDYQDQAGYAGRHDGYGEAWPADGGSGSWPPVENSGSWPAVDGAGDEFAAVYASLPASASRAGEEQGTHSAAFNLDPLKAAARGARQHSMESPGLRLVEDARVDPLTDPIGATTTAPALRVIPGGRPPRTPGESGRRGHRFADLLRDPVQLGLVHPGRRGRTGRGCAHLGSPGR